MYFQNYAIQKTCLDKCLNCLVSEECPISNRLTLIWVGWEVMFPPSVGVPLITQKQ